MKRDEATKAELLQRLGRIEGQVRGIRKLVEADAYCVDILIQISSITEALRGTGKVLLRNHIEHCVTDALRSEDIEKADKVSGELLDLVYKYAR